MASHRPNALPYGPSRLVRTLLLLLCIALGTTQGRAQSEAFGGIRGAVRDAEFGGGVAGATVTVQPGGATVSTDAEGSFFIQGLTPGIYALTVVREGYGIGRAADVVVAAGQVAERSVELIGDVLDVDEFVVAMEEIEEPAALSIELQQDLASLTTVLGGDFISKIGAADVGKVLQKVAGVSLIGDRYIVVRGLSDRYNVVQLNNAGVPSSDPDRRAVNVDLFPASIVRSLRTSKTFTPDLPGEATGGAINIGTKGTPDRTGAKLKWGLGYDTAATGNNRFLTYSGGGTGLLGTSHERRLPDFIRNAELPFSIAIGADRLPDQQLRDRVNESIPRIMGASRTTPGPDFAVEASGGVRGTFWGLPAGLLAGFDYRKQYRLDTDGFEGRYSFGPDGEAISARRRARVERGTESLRSSLLLVGGVETAPGDEIKLTLFANLAAQDRAAIRFGPKDTVPAGPIPVGSDYLYRESLAYTERRLQSLQLSGKQSWDDPGSEDAVLEWQATYSRSSQDEPDHRFAESDTNETLTRFFLPAVVPIPPFRRYWRRLDDERWNFSADFSRLLFEEEEQQTKFKAGVGFDYSSRDYRADNFAYNIGLNNDQGFPSASKPLPYLGATWADVWNYGNPLNVDVPASRPDLGHYLWRFTPPEFYDARQSIPHGYLMADADLSKNLNVVFGFRVEQTGIRIEASDISNIEEVGLAALLLPPEDRTQENINDLADPEAAKNNPAIQAARFVKLDQTHVLPAVSIRYALTDQMNLAAAWSRTIARPSFKELAPVLFRDAESGDYFAGNSQLHVSDITNYDLRWEWFTPRGGLLAVSGFAKAISDPIEKANVGVEQFINGNDGVLYGFELEADQNLGVIAEELRHFNVGINYAYIWSSVPRETESAFSPTRRLQGQPDYTFNFNLSYDNPDARLSAGLLLNVTGAYIDSLGAQNVADILVEPVTTLNAYLAYNVSKDFKITLRASNLTAQPIRRVYGNGGADVYDIVNTSTQYSISCELSW